MIANHPLWGHNYSYHIRGDRSPLTSERPTWLCDPWNEISFEDLFCYKISFKLYTKYYNMPYNKYKLRTSFVWERYILQCTFVTQREIKKE